MIFNTFASVFICNYHEDVIFLAVSGNGTLNKQAGIDYKQLSLLVKINENQSGEVGGTLPLQGHYTYRYFQSATVCDLSAVVAGSMARRRDHSEGAAGQRLDNSEEQGLQ